MGEVEQTNNLGDNFLSTKFWGTMAIIIMAYGLVWSGNLDAITWLQMSTAGVGIYSAANVIQKFK
jgi:hypothetical protein